MKSKAPKVKKTQSNDSELLMKCNNLSNEHDFRGGERDASVIDDLQRQVILNMLTKTQLILLLSVWLKNWH